MTAPALSFNTDNGRYYGHPAKRTSLPSITNIMRQQNKPGINTWVTRKAVEFTIDNRERLAALDRGEQTTLAMRTQYEKSEASVIGDIVHSWIERYVQGQPPAHDEVKQAHQTAQWMWDRFAKFVAYYKPEFTATEFTVWSDTFGYAGTGDLSMRINGAHVLADTKTGKSIYPETGMQLAALAKADVILYPDGREEPLPHYDAYAVLHIRPRSFTLAPVYKIEEAFETFLALKRVFDWNITHAAETIGYAPQMKDLPA